MKIAVSYLSSNDYKDSIKKIENSKADFVHCDICDGSYVKTNNFNKEDFLNLFNRVNKKLNVHLMVEYPKRYVDMLKGLNIDEIIIHNVKDTKDIIEYIKSLNIKVGIAINPDDNVMDYIKYFSLVDEVLVMSVNPGKGGQPFLRKVIPTIDYLYSVKDIYKFNDDELAIFRRRQVGLIYQFYNLIPILNVEENITLPLKLDNKNIDKQRLDELIKVLGLEERRTHLPNELSGGQQQRTSIGRAMITNPAIILADEPTGNLDSKASDEIVTLLKKSNKDYKQTIIMITHNLEIAKVADRIIKIEDGKIVEEV